MADEPRDDSGWYQAGPDRSSGLYVDVENLRADGQILIQDLLENWPATVPMPSLLSLYVRADQVELWKMWAESRFSDLKVVVKGVQHFSMSSSKNSADIAIAAAAMADLILQRITHIVVFSDDSDFISLYAAIRDEPDIPSADGQGPFLWAVTDRESSLSPTVRQFFPLDKLHVVKTERDDTQNATAPGLPTSEWSQAPREFTRDIYPQMAQAVLEYIPVGPFKSTDCQPIIKERWPDHSLANAGGPAFGTEFKNNILPVLERLGVKIINPGQKPVKYGMTQDAKRKQV